MDYEIIASGSSGNCTVINNLIAIDMGISYNKIKKYPIKLILLTHIHSDHFSKSTIKLLARNHPSLRFGCCEWLVNDLIKCGVFKKI